MRLPDRKDKRMPVILPAARYEAWLDASPQESMDFMRQFPADGLAISPEPEPPRTPGAKARSKQLAADR
ncbi:hypothetical protein RT97_27775 [Variovorax paradoxus]|uniref:DUF159 family protein n=1 Tax=Variovorax paradoxus TaxID=34073 RepID=A0A0D0K5F2_VARPD|nr:hypothetical protein RT97_27775 [Variovorax paradoxus]